MNSLFSLLVALLSLLRAAWSATLVIILTAAWFTGKSPVLTIGFSTRVTTSVGSTDAIAVAQLSAARSTWEREMVGFHIHQRSLPWFIAGLSAITDYGRPVDPHILSNVDMVIAIMIDSLLLDILPLRVEHYVAQSSVLVLYQNAISMK